MRSYFRGEIDDNHYEFKKFLNSSKGVVWDRSLGKEEPNCQILDTTLEKLGAKHIIVGHTPQDVINSKCNEKVWRIDVGLSKAMGGNNFQVLEITRENDKNTFKALYDAGISKVIDGYGIMPFKYKNIEFIPQLFYKLHTLPYGIQSTQLHINYWEEKD